MDGTRLKGLSLDGWELPKVLAVGSLGGIGMLLGSFEVNEFRARPVLGRDA
jgi:hypothetical protein